MCQLPEGQVAIVDFDNKKVMLLSSFQYSVIAELELPSNPRDICSISGEELVVTVCQVVENELEMSELHFIKVVRGRLSRSLCKQIDHYCNSVAFNNGQLYVSSAEALYEYSLSGMKMKKLYEDRSCQGRTVF